VRKLAENLAAQGVDVHVLARGREEDPVEQEWAVCSCIASASLSVRGT
jgi:choline dehydrogenase-like flavoprotein